MPTTSVSPAAAVQDVNHLPLTEILKNVARSPSQRQDSLVDQVSDVLLVAEALGLTEICTQIRYSLTRVLPASPLSSYAAAALNYVKTNRLQVQFVEHDTPYSLLSQLAVALYCYDADSYFKNLRRFK